MAGTASPMSWVRFLISNSQWLAAGALLTLLSSFGQTFFISIFAGEIRSEFGLSHGTWGGIYSLGTTVSAIVMIWAGILTDVWRVRVIGPVVLCGLALACLSMAIVPAIWMLPVSIFMLRLFGQGMTTHISMVAMSRWFVATRGRALSVASLGFSLGEAVLPIVFVGLLVVFDWRNLWGIAAVMSLIGAPLLILLLRQERTPQSIALSDTSTGMNGVSWTRKQTLFHPLFWFMVPAMLGPSAFNTAFFFHQVHFAEIKGWAHLELVSYFPLYTICAIFSMMLSGWALDKMGTARLIPYFQIPLIGAFVVFAYAQGPVGAIFGFILLSLTAGANSTLPTAFWAEFYGTAHIGAIKAMATAVMVFGSAIGPGITGALIDFGYGLETQFLWISAFFVFSTITMWIGVHRFKPSLPR